MLRVQLLGAVGAERDGQPVPIASSKQRLLLAVLACARGAVPRAQLVDALWPEEPPPSAVSSLMAYVSRLRGALGPEVLVSEAAGYRLVADQVDAAQFESVLRGPPSTVATLEGALALWRGNAFGDLADNPHLLPEATRLDVLHQEAHVRLAAACLEEGDATRPVAVLEAVVASEPLREDAWALLVVALLRCDRAAEAVLAANRARRALADVGLDAGPALAAAQAQALRHPTSARPSGERVGRTAGPVGYARNGDVHLAFQTVGVGGGAVVLSSYGSISIDAFWDQPRLRDFVLRLASSRRVVLYDTRGVGLSDPVDVACPPTLEEQSDDLHRVLQAADAREAVVVGVGDGGPTAVTYAHRHASALRGLVLVNTFARLVRAEDYPHGVPADRFARSVSRSVDPEGRRGTRAVLQNHAPSVADDPAFRAWWERAGRRGASPATAAALWQVRYGADVRPLLADLAVPTLVLHRRHARVVPYVHGAYLAEHVSGARLVPLEGADQPPFTQDAERIADLITAFAGQVTGPHPSGAGGAARSGRPRRP